MSILGNNNPHILPRTGRASLAFLSVVGTLEKMAIIEEGEDRTARNYSDLDLSNSIYTGKNE